MAGGTISSQLFWSLVDRWKLADLTALDLIGHAGGLTKRGTRPRFTLTADEAHRLADLLAIDRLLDNIQGEAASWLRRVNGAAPFRRTKPIDFMVKGGAPAIVATRRAVEMLALRKSL